MSSSRLNCATVGLAHVLEKLRDTCMYGDIFTKKWECKVNLQLSNMHLSFCSFAQCSNDFERQHVSKELNKMIEKVTAEDRLSVHRWALEPSPLPATAHANGTNNSSNSIATDAAAVTGKKRKSRWDEATPSNDAPSNSGVLTVNTNLPTPNSQ